MCLKLSFLPHGPGSSYCYYHPLHKWGNQGAEKLSKITQLVTGKVGFKSRQSGSSCEPELLTASQAHCQVLPEHLSLSCNLPPNVATTYTTCKPIFTLCHYTGFHTLLPDTLWSLHMLLSLRRTVFFMWWVPLLFKITSSVKPSLLSPNPPFLDPRHHDFPSGLVQTAFWCNPSIPEPAFLSRLWAPGLTQACDPAGECLGELKTWPVSQWNLMLPNQTWVH